MLNIIYFIKIVIHYLYLNFYYLNLYLIYHENIIIKQILNSNYYKINIFKQSLMIYLTLMLNFKFKSI